MNETVSIPFDNSYSRLSDRLFSRQQPTSVQQPTLIRLNDALAEVLGLNPTQLRGPEGVAVLAGNRIPEGAEPIATVYAGHQFGSWNPQLGDGRAILLGEVIGRDGQRYDLQLKGAGITPYSRMGDGRSPLGPVLREYIVSEAMAALGIPTTRSLAAVATGETVVRDTVLNGGILTRVAHSHIRVGTFQFFAARNDWETVRRLANHVIERHYPEIKAADNPYLSLLSEVIERQIQLIAQWQALGFIHGVMNTDNMLVSGETIDYGPCAFMEHYHPGTVYSSIDRGGRYAYGNQPAIAHWNLAWLAQSLLPLINENEEIAISAVQTELDTFSDRFLKTHRQRMSAKLGFTEISDTNTELLLDFLSLLTQHQVDFTLGFRALADLLETDDVEENAVAKWYALPEVFSTWLQRWRQQLAINNLSSLEIETVRRRLKQNNPVFIPRNHQVEAAIDAGYAGDFSPFHQLVDVLANPFDYDPAWRQYALPATPEQRVTRTFCGT